MKEMHPVYVLLKNVYNYDHKAPQYSTVTNVRGIICVFLFLVRVYERRLKEQIRQQRVFEQWRNWPRCVKRRR